MTRYALMRHGLTEWNLDKRIQGQTDTHLTPQGDAQARAWAESLRSREFDMILCSDLVRARRTAEIAARFLKGRPLPDKRLREQDWGQWTGRTVAELRKAFPGQVEAQETRGWDFKPPGGESRRKVLHRAKAVLAAQWPDAENVLVVTHNGVLKCLLTHATGGVFGLDEPDPASGYKLHWIALEDGVIRYLHSEEL